jgi:lipopolysaccharide/colanic/teichoic acid biosynthesis glycosyltransferase
MCKSWIDGVLLALDRKHINEEQRILEGGLIMGLVVHQSLGIMADESGKKQVIDRIGKYTVLSNAINISSTGQLFVKRTMDIIGGIVGTIFTGILFLFVAPAIYIKSPGPIFFKQTRIGQNGKKFKLYKFRSMYMDAEERKAELMKQNKIQDGMMFKIENDPRIIGGENGKGIGNFIRKHSIDEFPQFINVLKGDMSLVGTRPPTEDEWVKYDLHHRKRMAIKPGITGMWQTSGRSDIIDFEEVVKLDAKYITNWSIGLDIKLILKTFFMIFKSDEGSY